MKNEPEAITVEQARAIDRDAVDRLGMPSLLLMENAARGVVEVARSLGDRWVILCGPGNNGGDGLAVARHLGRTALVFLLDEPRAGSDAAIQFDILRRSGFEIATTTPPDLAEDGVVWVDAMFGTGLSRPLVGRAALWVEAFNRARGPKISVDIPSGLHGDSGEVLGVACRADVTATFEAPKLGLVSGSGPEFAGRIEVVSLGLP